MRRDRFAGDNSRYIASARRLCLLILALGLVAAQSARDESRYQAAQTLYPYVEKVLTVAKAIRYGKWKKGRRSEKAGILGPAPKGLELLVPMVGDAAKMHLVEFAGGSSTLATSADPTNNCNPKVYQLNSAPGNKQEMLALWVLQSLSTADDAQARFKNTFIVQFDASCPELHNLFDPFLVVQYDESNRGEGIVLSDGVLQRLGIDWPPPNDQEERLRDSDRKQLTTVDLTLLKGLVLSEARAATHRNYAVGDVDTALQAILRGPGADSLDMWGVRIRAALVPLLFPIALLSLAFSLLYRLRRIDPSGDIEGEPWVVVRPDGIVERVGAAAWSIMPIIAAAGVTWATWVHHHSDRMQAVWPFEFTINSIGDVPQFMEWLMQTSLVWSLVFSFVAMVFLFQAMVWMWHIGHRGPNAFRWPVEDHHPLY